VLVLWIIGNFTIKKLWYFFVGLKKDEELRLTDWKREAGCRKSLLSKTGSKVLMIKLNLLSFYLSVFLFKILNQ